MTRAPILSAVAAALLLGLAAAGPGAAEDAATPATPATTPSATPAPVKGEFDNSCAMGLTEGQTIKTDCSVNWTAPDGKVYCFSSEKSKDTFLKNAEANIAVYDRGFTARVEAMFLADLARCDVLSKERWSRRGVLDRIGEFFFFLFSENY